MDAAAAASELRCPGFVSSVAKLKLSADNKSPEELVLYIVTNPASMSTASE